MMNTKVTLSPYKKEWQTRYQKEAEVITNALPGLLSIHHVGSTSVPGLSAKPIIDIIAVVKDRMSTVQSLEKLGYVFKGEYNIPFRSYFNKPDFNLHMYEEGHPEIELNLTFRDFLRSHPNECLEYEKLKIMLANDADAGIKRGMFKGYTLGKDTFIKDCLLKAGYKGVRFLKATHFNELAFAKKYCDESFLKDPKHSHLVLYEGIELIGYGHVDPGRKTIYIKVKEELEKHFRELLLKWVNKEDYDSNRSCHDWSYSQLE